MSIPGTFTLKLRTTGGSESTTAGIVVVVLVVVVVVLETVEVLELPGGRGSLKLVVP